MRVLYIGNFEPPHSTENHVKRALEYNGHEVEAVQENAPFVWWRMAKGDWGDPDFILWTRTGWDYKAAGYSVQQEALGLQWQMLAVAGRKSIPTVAYHLDLFFGLGDKRVAILDEPFFMCDVVITADGGHPVEFAARNINHTWFPPAVSLAETEPGTYREELASPLAFVGNWQGDYHREYRHRHELVAWLQEHYLRDCAFWPKRGHPAVRGEMLRDLYASVDVVIGDSCFAGEIPNYWSDRVPETLGRGGFLIHPHVDGLSTAFPPPLPWMWSAGTWPDLAMMIRDALDLTPAERRERGERARRWVQANHTYEKRMEQLVELLQERSLL